MTRDLHTGVPQLQLSFFKGLTSSFRCYLSVSGLFVFSRIVIFSVGHAKHLSSQLCRTQRMVFFATWQLSGIKQLCFERGRAKHKSDGAKCILQEELKDSSTKATPADTEVSRNILCHSGICLVFPPKGSKSLSL